MWVESFFPLWDTLFQLRFAVTNPSFQAWPKVRQVKQEHPSENRFSLELQSAARYRFQTMNEGPFSLHKSQLAAFQQLLEGKLRVLVTFCLLKIDKSPLHYNIVHVPVRVNDSFNCNVMASQCYPRLNCHSVFWNGSVQGDLILPCEKITNYNPTIGTIWKHQLLNNLELQMYVPESVSVFHPPESYIHWLQAVLFCWRVNILHWHNVNLSFLTQVLYKWGTYLLTSTLRCSVHLRKAVLTASL